MSVHAKQLGVFSSAFFASADRTKKTANVVPERAIFQAFDLSPKVEKFSKVLLFLLIFAFFPPQPTRFDFPSSKVEVDLLPVHCTHPTAAKRIENEHPESIKCFLGRWT